MDLKYSIDKVQVYLRLEYCPFNFNCDDELLRILTKVFTQKKVMFQRGKMEPVSSDIQISSHSLPMNKRFVIKTEVKDERMSVGCEVHCSDITMLNALRKIQATHETCLSYLQRTSLLQMPKLQSIHFTSVKKCVSQSKKTAG